MKLCRFQIRSHQEEAEIGGIGTLRSHVVAEKVP